MRANPTSAKFLGRAGLAIGLAVLAWASPAVGAWVEVFGDHFEAGEISTNRWDAQATTVMDMSTVTSMNLLDPIDATNDLGIWIDWALEVRWDWHPDGSGLARLYKDGVLIAERSGPNAFNDAKGPNSKIGLYKWSWDRPANIQLRVAHYDDVRIFVAADETP